MGVVNLVVAAYLISTVLFLGLVVLFYRNWRRAGKRKDYSYYFAWFCLAEGLHNGYYVAVSVLMTYNVPVYEALRAPPFWAVSQAIVPAALVFLAGRIFTARELVIGDLSELCEVKSILERKESSSLPASARTLTGQVLLLSETLNALDPYTATHSSNVAYYSAALAKFLGLPKDQEDLLKSAALLHDIGKIGVPDCVLHKPGPLSEEERRIMNAHPQIGAGIIFKAGGLLAPLIPLVQYHHQRYDRRGYPEGWPSDPDTELLVAIISLADAFDAMTMDRPFRKALPLPWVREELLRCSGSQFHPGIVAAFVALLDTNKEVLDRAARSAKSHPTYT